MSELTPREIRQELANQEHLLNEKIREIQQIALCITTFELTLTDEVALKEQLHDATLEIEDISESILKNRHWLDFLELENTLK